MRRPPLPRLPARSLRGWLPGWLPGPSPVTVRPGRHAPPARLLVSELPRAAVELSAALTAAPLLALERRGDGHPVLVLPGLWGGDVSTLLLRHYLGWLGYSVTGWQLGANVGPTESVVRGLRDRVAQLSDSSGRRVTLLGWSLGGLYAHELARKAPGSVRAVITLGSPLRLAGRGSRGASKMFDAMSHLHVTPSLVARPWTEAGPLRVPATAVYTRSDGVVPWRSCLVHPGRRRESVEVHGSHSGLVNNPTVLHLLADRLTQPEDHWRPFAPGPLVRHLYP